MKLVIDGENCQHSDRPIYYNIRPYSTCRLCISKSNDLDICHSYTKWFINVTKYRISFFVCTRTKFEFIA